MFRHLPASRFTGPTITRFPRLGAPTMKTNLPLLPQPLPDPLVQQLSPGALAYLGDAVYELYIRANYLIPAKRLHLYHSQVVAQVRAETQAQHLRSLAPHFTPAETEIVRRGRNAATGRPKRLSVSIYQQATGLETLIGYLYLKDPQRLTYLLAQLQIAGDTPVAEAQPQPCPPREEMGTDQ